jgi:hypothetical protein
VGLFSALLTAPLQPVRGVGWIASQLAAEAERIMAEQQDPRRLMLELQQARDDGRITQEEFDEAEDELLRRLTQPSTVVLRRDVPEEGMS